MKRFWITEDFRGRGYWAEEPNIAKAVERHGEEAIAITFGVRKKIHVLVLYPDGKFHMTAGDVEMEVQYDPRIRKWIYREGEQRFVLSLSRETISNLLFHAREMIILK